MVEWGGGHHGGWGGGAWPRVIQGVSKKNATEIQQAVVHHKLNKTIQFLHRTKELLFSFSMIYFLNRNDEKWPHTRQIKIFGRNHILPQLGIENTLIMQS